MMLENPKTSRESLPGGYADRRSYELACATLCNCIKRRACRWWCGRREIVWITPEEAERSLVSNPEKPPAC